MPGQNMKIPAVDGFCAMRRIIKNTLKGVLRLSDG